MECSKLPFPTVRYSVRRLIGITAILWILVIAPSKMSIVRADGDGGGGDGGGGGPVARLLHIRGQALEKAKDLFENLLRESNEDLISASVLEMPCDTGNIECNGLTNLEAKALVTLAIHQKQTDKDGYYRQWQVFAAVASAGIALLSLAISVVSFMRASRAVTSTALPTVGKDRES
jgi:hypothetical protein